MAKGMAEGGAVCIAMWGGRKKNIKICTWFRILDIPLGIRWEMYPKSKSS